MDTTGVIENGAGKALKLSSPNFFPEILQLKGRIGHPSVDCCEGTLVAALQVEAAGSNWMTWKTFQSNLAGDHHGTAPGAVVSSLGNEQGLEASPGESVYIKSWRQGRGKRGQFNYRSSKTRNVAAVEREELVKLILIHKSHTRGKSFLKDS